MKGDANPAAGNGEKRRLTDAITPNSPPTTIDRHSTGAPRRFLLSDHSAGTPP